MYYLVYLLALVILLIVFSSLYYRFSHAGRLLAKIPNEAGLFIFGNSFSLIITPEELFNLFRQMYVKNKGLWKMTAFHKRFVNIYNPDDIEKILSTSRFNEKQDPYTFLRPWLGKGLLTSIGDHKWLKRRKILTSAFHFNILKQFSKTFFERTDRLLSCLDDEVGKERTDVVPIISNATLAIMCETSMGTEMKEDIESVCKKYFDAIHTLGYCTVYRTVRVWLHPDIIYKLTPAYRLETKTLNILHTFTEKIIKERKILRKDEDKSNLIDVNSENCYGGKKGRLALLDLLLQSENEGEIDDIGIREEVDTFMFEGHDTTASALCFFIMRIANEPVVQDKLYEEMQAIFGDSDRSPTNEDLTVMKYLECCVKESLRLYPSVPLITRHLNEDVVLDGYTVPAGTEVNLNIYDIHRRADLYPDPDKFIPERFLPQNVVSIHPYAYIPFSAGPRNCIGQKFAMMELKTVISGLVRRFRLEPVTRPDQITFTVNLVLRAAHPIYVKFTKRT